MFSRMFLKQAVIPFTVGAWSFSSHGGQGKSKDGKVDQVTLDKLEADFKKLQGASNCHSLLKKYLTKGCL
ncbi:hypothetical protein MRX96_055021 [Rhipicephalus microplus]